MASTKRGDRLAGKKAIITGAAGWVYNPSFDIQLWIYCCTFRATPYSVPQSVLLRRPVFVERFWHTVSSPSYACTTDPLIDLCTYSTFAFPLRSPFAIASTFAFLFPEVDASVSFLAALASKQPSSLPAKGPPY